MPVSKYWAGLFHSTSGAQPRGAAALPSPPAGIGKESHLLPLGAWLQLTEGTRRHSFFPSLYSWLGGCLGRVDTSGLTSHRCGVVGSLTTQTGIQCSGRTPFLTDAAWRIPRAVGATAPPPCGER